MHGHVHDMYRWNAWACAWVHTHRVSSRYVAFRLHLAPTSEVGGVNSHLAPTSEVGGPFQKVGGAEAAAQAGNPLSAAAESFFAAVRSDEGVDAAVCTYTHTHACMHARAL